MFTRPTTDDGCSSPRSRRHPIRSKLLALGSAALVAACLSSSTPTEIDDGGFADDWQAFSIEQMRADRRSQGVSFLQVLVEPRFRMGVFHTPAGGGGSFIVHAENVLYYVVEGEALVSTESEEHPVGPGSVIFVRSLVEHRIRQVQSDLDLLVIFGPLPERDNDPEIVSFEREEMVVERNDEESVFTPLLNTSALNLGMYMVPKGIEDERMTHDIDEFKIIVEGAGRFDLGSGGVWGQAGRVTYIEQGVPHRFHRISEALDVLVVWAPR